MLSRRSAGHARRTLASSSAASPKATCRSWHRSTPLALTDWPDQRKQAFLNDQFQAQHAHYQRYYPGADWLVTMRGGESIGRLYIARWPSQHRIIDIALLPAHRGIGLGEALLRDLIDEAAAAGKAVSIHVEKFNPAMRLYRRLGFTTEEDKGVYDLMRWTAARG
jgi:ribosomal protein S18 acetylase RimI-like enzyme